MSVELELMSVERKRNATHVIDGTNVTCGSYVNYVNYEPHMLVQNHR